MEKGKKRGQIGKISASEASPAVVWGGGKGGGAWRHAFDAAGIMLWLVKCLHVDRFAVLLTVSRSFSFTFLLSGKRFFKTRISIGAAIQISLRDFSLILRLQEEQKMCL